MSKVKVKTVEENVRQLLNELPPGVVLLAAAKGCDTEKVMQAVQAGVRIIGESYVQEAEAARSAVESALRQAPFGQAQDKQGEWVMWHFIGHLQKNKVKKAVMLFDLIESVDSIELAREIDKQCKTIGKVMPVLIEVNSGREEQKSGVLPEEAEQLAREITASSNLRLSGLMTVGPYSIDPEDIRPCFAETRRLFEKLKSLKLPGVEMKYLSMGMSDSYKIAIEEGANIVRIGTKIFGERV